MLHEPIFINGSHLDNVILIHMPQLRTFTFYITAESIVADSVVHLSSGDIQRTFTNPKHGRVTFMVDYVAFLHYHSNLNISKTYHK